MLMLEEVQVVVEATRDTVSVRGMLSVEPPMLVTEEATCRYSCNGDKPALGVGVPFRVAVRL